MCFVDWCHSCHRNADPTVCLLKDTPQACLPVMLWDTDTAYQQVAVTLVVPEEAAAGEVHIPKDVVQHRWQDPGAPVRCILTVLCV